MVTEPDKWAHRCEVELARRKGSSWGPFEGTPYLRAEMAQLWTAPKISTAELLWKMPSDSHPLRWRECFGCDDRVRLKLYRKAGWRIVFEGFITEVHASGDWRDATVTATANSHAWRLERDVIVWGQYRKSHAGTVTFYSGLPLVFNPEGRPNMVADKGDEAYPYFVPPGDLDNAAYWTWIDVFDYFQGRHNDQKWVHNKTWVDGYRDGQPIFALTDDFTGQRLWSTLARVARAGRHAIYETLVFADSENDGTSVRHQIEATSWDAGDRYSMALQVPDDAGVKPALDAKQTNLFSFSIVEDCASCITEPMVMGGRNLYEVAVPLKPAWDSDDLDSDVKPPSGTIPAPNDLMHAEWCRRHVVGGDKFADYWEVGRLWLANSDARIYGQVIPDVAPLAGHAVGYWPHMKFETYNLLADGNAARGAGPYVEISFDSGGFWYRLRDCRVIGDELGCVVTARDLRQVECQPGSPSVAIDTTAENLWEYLGSSELKLRLVCVIAAPVRMGCKPLRRAGAGTVFAQTAWIDRGSQYQVRKRAESSPLYTAGGKHPAGEATFATVSKQILQETIAVQQATESKLIHARLSLEWIDPDVELTNYIDRIEGAEVWLGPVLPGYLPGCFARIVGMRMNFQAYSQDLVLMTDREAAVT